MRPMGGSPNPSRPAGHAREPEDDQRHRENAQDDVAPAKARPCRLGGRFAKFIHAGPPDSLAVAAGARPATMDSGASQSFASSTSAVTVRFPPMADTADERLRGNR